jgi:hypothetical protein
VQSDPIGIDGGLNTYVYGLDNPLRYADVEGLDPSACPTPECLTLAKKIQNVEQRINRRRGQLDENPNTLPEAAPGDDKNPGLSRRGHRRLINEDKQLLAGLKALYLAKCMQNQPATTIPTPETSPIEEWMRGRRPRLPPGFPQPPVPTIPGIDPPTMPPLPTQ